MRQILFVPLEEREVAQLEAILGSRDCHVTATPDTQAAGKLIQDSRYDALIISESLTHGVDRPRIAELIELAERRRIPIVLFPDDPGAVLPRVDPLLTQPTNALDWAIRW